ncbi:MAG: hypothetical protein Kow0073_13190 [Immundisolibacter sp.]
MEPGRNGGFSRADPQRLFLPPVMDPIYGYDAVNVEAQTRSPSSLLNRLERLIAARKNHRARGQLQRELLAPDLRGKRWFADKGRTIARIDIHEQGEWRHGDGSWPVTVLDVRFSDGEPHSYFLPLAIAWEDSTADETLHALQPWTLARAREKARMAVLYDAFGDDGFCRALVRGMDAGAQAPLERGRLQFRATGALTDLAGGPGRRGAPDRSVPDRESTARGPLRTRQPAGLAGRAGDRPAEPADHPPVNHRHPWHADCVSLDCRETTVRWRSVRSPTGARLD